MKIRIVLFLLIIITGGFTPAHSQSGGKEINVSIIVKDQNNRSLLEVASILFKGGSKQYSGIADSSGKRTFTHLSPGSYLLSVTYLGYEPHNRKIYLTGDTTITVPLKSNTIAMQDVVVTASESKGITSASRIDRKAMEHLQPSSFTDIMELLPGNVSSDPVMGSANLIKLREANGKGITDYNMTSLGTAFVIDGIPQSTDANMQYTGNPWETGRNTTGKGIDMRSISTDDIEKVEVIRGIPSVEYGDLTSGLVNIERKKGGNSLDARFKADMYSKLFYVGKGVELPDKDFMLNIGLDYLDSKIDPRDRLQKFKRVTSSVRTEKKWKTDVVQITLNSNLNYFGTFDQEDTDPDLNTNGAIDLYKSRNNKISLGNTLILSNRNKGVFRTLTLFSSLSGEWDHIHQEKTVTTDRIYAIPAATEQGAHNAGYLPGTYNAELDVYGNPFNAFVKALALFNMNSERTTNILKLGGDWNMNKNYGKGQVYDLTRPVSPSTNSRPRAFNDIPAGHTFSAFAEEATKVKTGKHRFDIVTGLRTTTLLNLNKRYELSGKWYIDPRINLKWTFPAFNVAGKKLGIELSGGIGWHTKMPVLSYLYPDPYYYDLLQLNYYHNNPEYRRLNIMTYITDKTNYALEAARNKKWELRADFSFDGNRFSVTWFREDMKSGFRNAAIPISFAYKKYDTGSIDANNITAPPCVEDLPFSRDTLLNVSAYTTNGSRMLKEGIEFQYLSKRFPVILTRLTINGAWFRTTYRNSEPIYKKPSVILNGKQLQYAGLYHDDDGYLRESFNTNFTFDTDIPRLKMGFSTSIQCMWFYTTQSMYKSGIPAKYIDASGTAYDFTEESHKDTYLQHLVYVYDEINFKRRTIPIEANINFKATKKIWQDKIALALFVNKLISYQPDYIMMGNKIRRQSSPYFGIEINFKL